jgi:hypothetical protein
MSSRSELWQHPANSIQMLFPNAFVFCNNKCSQNISIAKILYQNLAVHDRLANKFHRSSKYSAIARTQSLVTKLSCDSLPSLSSYETFPAICILHKVMQMDDGWSKCHKRTPTSSLLIGLASHNMFNCFVQSNNSKPTSKPDPCMLLPMAPMKFI